MILMVFLLRHPDTGVEYRFERYAKSSSRMDAMLAEDSAIIGFHKVFGTYPAV